LTGSGGGKAAKSKKKKKRRKDAKNPTKADPDPVNKVLSHTSFLQRSYVHLPLCYSVINGFALK
jgi:hypothetical protein